MGAWRSFGPNITWAFVRYGHKKITNDCSAAFPDLQDSRQPLSPDNAHHAQVFESHKLFGPISHFPYLNHLPATKQLARLYEVLVSINVYLELSCQTDQTHHGCCLCPAYGTGSQEFRPRPR